MIYIEDEFEELMKAALATIAAKELNGEYSSKESSQLHDMIIQCMDHVIPSRYGRTCPEGHSDPENCGWSPSMGYHC